jgi:hypothetical protein
MTPAERAASEAQRLLNEPLLVEALDAIMGDAFAEFKDLQITPDTLHQVIALQQRVIVVQEIFGQLKAKITAAGLNDGGVTIETKPTAH